MWTLVTGGAKRLGAALCVALAEQGRSIVVHYRSSRQEALEVVELCRAKGVEANAIQGDFGSVPQVQEFVKRYLQQFSETSALINNVGTYLIGSGLQTTIEDWMPVFQTNLYTPFILSQALTPSLIASKGHIVNIGASGLKRCSANTYATAYQLAKEGLWGLTLALARELASKDVRVNMVSPGLLEASIDQYPIPMNRAGYFWEICRVVSFLLDPASSYITGQNIEVAGGLGLA